MTDRQGKRRILKRKVPEAAESTVLPWLPSAGDVALRPGRLLGHRAARRAPPGARPRGRLPREMQALSRRGSCLNQKKEAASVSGGGFEKRSAVTSRPAPSARRAARPS